MKLIIDINNNEYMGIKEYSNNITSYPITIHLYDAVRNGTPLDDLRAEIEQTAIDYDKFDDYRRIRGLWIALDIIDKYKAESEE